MTTEGLLDGSSIFEVASVLEGARNNSPYPMAWQTSIDVTTAVISGQHLGVLGTPGFERTPGESGLLLRGLGTFMPRMNVDKRTAGLARTQTTEFASSAAGKQQLLAAIDRLHHPLPHTPLDPSASFQAWLNRISETYWVPQNRYIGGVFDEWQVPAISSVLGMDAADVEDVRLMAANELELSRILRDRSGYNADWRILVECYVVANFLRGMQHERVAICNAWQYVPHPIRLIGLQASSAHIAGSYVAASTVDYLSKIILGGAMAESTRKRRVELWLDSVHLARRGVYTREIDLYHRDSPEEALRAAVRAAKSLGIRTHPRNVERILDATISIGITAATTFTLVEWQSLVVGLALYGATVRSDFGEMSASLWYRRSKKLEDLALSEPGRVQRSY